MKICFFVQGDEGYGVQRRFQSLAAALVKQGHSVVAISCESSNFTDILQEITNGVTVLGLSSPGDFGVGLVRRIGRFAKSQQQSRVVARSLATAIDKVRPEHLIFAHNHLVSVVGLACKMARNPTRPVWLMANLISDKYPLNINRRFYCHQVAKYSVDVIGNSEYTFKTLFGETKTPRVVHLGADEKKFAPPVDPSVGLLARKDLNISEQAAVIGIFSRLIPVKGQLVFAQALEKYLQAHPDQDIHLIICGGPCPSDYSALIQTIAQDKAVRGRIHLLGRVDRPEMLIPACDILANPHQGAEPFGISVIEAMLSGKPILVRGLGGPAETVLDGITGWHAPASDVKSYAEAIERAMLDRDKWAIMGERARAHCLEHFTSDGMAKRLCAALEEPLAI